MFTIAFYKRKYQTKQGLMRLLYFIYEAPQTNKLRSAVRVPVPGRPCYGSIFSYHSFLVVFCKRGLMIVMLLLYFLNFLPTPISFLKRQLKPRVAKQTHYEGNAIRKLKPLQRKSKPGSLNTMS